MRQWRIINGLYMSELGLALSHPLYIFIARCWSFLPFGDIVTRCNTASGIGMALALANTGVLVFFMTRRVWISCVIAGMLAVSHTVWWLATITEVYSWHLAFFTGELLVLAFLIRSPSGKKVCLLFLLSGLGWCIHNLALLPLPVYLFVVVVLIQRKNLPMRTVCYAAGAYLAGASPYIAMTAGVAVSSGDVVAAVREALFGGYANEVLGKKINASFIKANAFLASLNFVHLLLPLAFLGWVAMKRLTGGLFALSLALVTGIEALFVVRYFVPDQFMFLLPTLVMIALAASLGLKTLEDRFCNHTKLLITVCVFSILLPPVVYASLPGLMRMSGIAIQRKIERPFRDELRYWIVPWKHTETSAEQFAAAALQEASPQGIILCDNTALYPLKIVQMRDRAGPGIEIYKSMKQLRDRGVSAEALDGYVRGGRLFIISPFLSVFPSGFADTVRFYRPEGKVLYTVAFKGDEFRMHNAVTP